MYSNTDYAISVLEDLKDRLKSISVPVVIDDYGFHGIKDREEIMKIRKRQLAWQIANYLIDHEDLFTIQECYPVDKYRKSFVFTLTVLRKDGNES